ncbi:Protein-glutamate methylesterase/protein-glutamine glutaminase [Sulfidibacter corallicola]|uniref:Protein-glutamate methylesterase/protein-glutamine glutaminase n=1 Tax=Sulfidibacter corallicola TaxID=2818388 RepID=A0A8A4TCW8_SULCO|nr:chemotaxis response regulator protein-glutamate methylesterase [Sulfidibacter corallicola]QTD47523.1 chemotaxis response regulator protein-glutamate methylesterase [Sulfidibacter corallicola]
MERKKIRVLVVDDSALVRQVISQGLGQDPGIEVVGTASNPYIARDKIIQLRPDVLTLDVEMPRMDGVEFLRKLMPQFPLPVVIVSALTERGKQITLDAMEAGAVEIVTKPSSNVGAGLTIMMQELRTKVKIASTVNVSYWKNRRVPKAAPSSGRRALAESTDKVIGIGASTGGTEAIREILVSLPTDTPGIVIVQHMPPGFTRMFAQRLNQQCNLLVKEATDGDRVIAGQALIAPGDKHVRVVRRGGIYSVKCDAGETVCGHCPSVDVLMESLSREVGANALGVILTGMGRDGANGLLKLRQAGGRTLGQNQESCVVYGMPREAFEIGAVEKQAPLDQMAVEITNKVRSMEKAMKTR